MAEAISARIGLDRFNFWVRGHTRFIPLGDRVIVAVRNEQARGFLEDTFGADIRAAVEEVFGPGIAVGWVIDEQAVNDAASTAQPEPATTEKPPAPEPPKETVERTLFGDEKKLNKTKPRRGETAEDNSGRNRRRWMSLADFIPGPDTRFALNAAKSVVESPGAEINPLVIYGPVGTGKSHLLQGIYAGLKRLSDQRPLFVSSEEFTNQFVQATHSGKMGSFRRRFRECTALLFDDLCVLSTKRLTQQEFLNTFDALLADGRQVVVTMDCHPRHADELLPELVDRLLGGVNCQLVPPDSETRLEILRAKAGTAAPVFPEPVLKQLAETLRGNVRELEGAVTTIRHFAKSYNRPIDLALAAEALGDLLRHAVRVVTMADVDEAVCGTLNLAAGTLQSKVRTLAVTHPRMLAIFLCRRHTSATFGEISKFFGASTHSTAINAEKKVREWMENNQDVAIGDRTWACRELIARIERRLQR